MKHVKSTDEVRERAALYALGVMSPEESAAYMDHLREGCPICDGEIAAFGELVATLAEVQPNEDPPADLGRRLLQRVREDRSGPAIPTQLWKNWEPENSTGPLFLKRRDQGEWRATGTPGVLARRLYVDRPADRVTMLIRMLPGTSYPSHRHAGAEECYVLSGDLRLGETVLRAGDYQRVESGEVHDVQSTDDGCLLLIVSSLHDEILA